MKVIKASITQYIENIEINHYPVKLIYELHDTVKNHYDRSKESTF